MKNDYLQSKQTSIFGVLNGLKVFANSNIKHIVNTIQVKGALNRTLKGS